MNKKPVKPFSYLFIIIFFICLKINAQDVPYDATSHIKSYTVSPPDIYNFEKFKLNPLNHYTGKASVGIPIFTINTGNISYPISLNYDTGGIKVDQLASNVGLGWNLSKTVITRTINQDNDFNNLGNNIKDNAGISTSDPYYYTYGTTNESLEEQQAWLDGSGNVGYFLAKRRNIPMSNSNKNVDLLPDTYNFYTSNFSTSFFFNDPTTPIEIIPKGTLFSATIGKQTFETYFASIGPKKFNLYGTTGFYDFPTQDFFSITLTTKEGIKYIFNDFDLSASYSLRQGKKYFAPAQISAWHISQIIDTNTGKSVTFEYDTTTTNPYAPIAGSLTEEERQYVLNATQYSYNYTALPTTNGSTCDNYYFREDAWTRNITTTSRIDVQLKRLKAINFEEGKIAFYYNGDSPLIPNTGGARLDIHNGDFLTTIEVKNKNSNTINSFQLSYDYFQSNNNVGEFNPNNFAEFNDFRYKRLKLTEFKEAGKPAYKFTYDESIKLPPINSFSVDFLGYYNQSPDVQNLNTIITTKPNPKLYYYPNKYEYSLLPFAVTGTTYSTINGYFDRTANDYSKAWTLTNIQYPTGGETQFIYESNSFEVFGKTIKGGGVRISKQVLKDGLGGTQTVEYSYNKESGISSGKLSSIPFFGHPTTKFFDVTVDPADIYSFIPSGTSTNVIDWKLFDKSNLNEDIAIGAYVGYSRIIEKEIGNGYKEFKFTSNEESENKNLIQRTNEPYIAQTTVPATGNCMANFLILNSGIGAHIFTDNSYRRSKPLEENIFSESNTPIQKTKFTYTDYTNGSYLFGQPISRPIQSLNVDDNIRHLLTAVKIIKTSNYFPSEKTVTLFDGSTEHKTVENYTYTNYGLIKTKSLVDSNSDIQKTTFYYPKDVINVNSLPGGALTSTELTSILAMKGTSHNYISTPLQVDQHSNTIIKSRTRTLFTRHALNDRVLPSTVKAAFGDRPFQSEIEFHQYDLGASKALELSQKGGPKTVFIWGYNKTQMIAKIENTNYSAIPTATISNLQSLSNSEYSDSTEENLRTALNNLRSTLPNAMVTTYTYDPLVGVKSITDPRGNTVYYTYDSLNRLRFVKDNEGTILSQNEYNYKQ